MLGVSDFSNFATDNVGSLMLAVSAVVVFISGSIVLPNMWPERMAEKAKSREQARIDTVNDVSSRFKNAFEELLAEPAFAERTHMANGLRVTSAEEGGGRIVSVIRRTCAPALRLFIGCDGGLETDIWLQYGTNVEKTRYDVVSADALEKQCESYLRKNYGPIDMRA